MLRRSDIARGLTSATTVVAMSLVIVLSAVFVWVSPAFADVSGKPRIIDGDTIDIAGQRIRLHGMDAPEAGQVCEAEGKYWRCGQEATWALANIIGRTWVTCMERDKDRYGRIVAVCKVGGPRGLDVGSRMVAEGWALAYRKYSKDYVGAEDAAKEASTGLWRGTFVPPWEWRRGKRLASEAANDNRECPIKGNIGKRGTRIYHVPGGSYYSRTKINKAKGERWFCSEEEAVAAGWRRSKR
jgi:endonuclease YncB( thermonuclease family)